MTRHPLEYLSVDIRVAAIQNLVPNDPWVNNHPIPYHSSFVLRSPGRAEKSVRFSTPLVILATTKATKLLRIFSSSPPRLLPRSTSPLVSILRPPTPKPRILVLELSFSSYSQFGTFAEHARHSKMGESLVPNYHDAIASGSSMAEPYSHAFHTILRPRMHRLQHLLTRY